MLRRFGPAILFALALAAPAGAAVTFPYPGVVKANGPINGLTHIGSRIVLTGAFEHIGPYVGGGVALDPGSGARDPAFARFDGQVSDVIGDGKGGFYVAGQFRLGGPPRAVAHVLPSGALDPKFDATMPGFADALALDGGRLYVGRWFYDHGLVALDPATGRRDATFKAPSIAPVTEVLAADGRIYAGSSSGVFAFAPDTGKPDQGFDCRTCNDRVMSLAATDGRLYIGSRNDGLQAVDLDTAAPIPTFAPALNTVSGGLEDEGPMVLLVQGTRLIVGGRGMRLGGPSSTLAAVDLQTGKVDPDFGRGFTNPIHDLVENGDSLLVAGAPRSGHSASITRIDATTGAYQGALTPMLDGPIDALAGANGRLFVGGRFASANTIATDGVAEVNARTGELVPGFAVHDLPEAAKSGRIMEADGRLIFGWSPYGQGKFSRARLVAVSARTGAPRPSFAPRPLRFPDAGWVGEARFAATRGRVYVAHPTHDNGSKWPISGVDVLSSTTGARIAHYHLPYPGYVDVLEPHGTRLFVGGSFLRRWPDGRPRNLATMAVGALTGTIDDRFDAHTNGPITTIADFRDRLYLSGYFDRAYGRKRRGFVSAYDNTGAINAGFSRRLGAITTVGTGLIGGYSRDGQSLFVVDPYTGRIQGRVPQVIPGFRDTDFVFTAGGAYVIATLNLPYYSYGGSYDEFAGFVGALE